MVTIFWAYSQRHDVGSALSCTVIMIKLFLQLNALYSAYTRLGCGRLYSFSLCHGPSAAYRLLGTDFFPNLV